MSSNRRQYAPDGDRGQVATWTWTQGGRGRRWGFRTAGASLGGEYPLEPPESGDVSIAAAARRGRGGGPSRSPW